MVLRFFLGSVDSVLSQCIWKYSKSRVEKGGENKEKMGMTWLLLPIFLNEKDFEIVFEYNRLNVALTLTA